MDRKMSKVGRIVRLGGVLTKAPDAFQPNLFWGKP
jgi:hypothetical protein